MFVDAFSALDPPQQWRVIPEIVASLLSIASLLPLDTAAIMDIHDIADGSDISPEEEPVPMPETHARAYQLEMFELSMRANIIVTVCQSLHVRT